MFRHTLAILLLVAFAAQTFNRTIIVLDYYVNVDAFARNCENKAKPRLQCHGKCQMMKKLQEEEKKDQGNPERRLENKNEVIAHQTFFAQVNDKQVSANPPFGDLYNCSTAAGARRGIFHPPAFA